MLTSARVKRYSKYVLFSLYTLTTSSRTEIAYTAVDVICLPLTLYIGTFLIIQPPYLDFQLAFTRYMNEIKVSLNCLSRKTHAYI